MFEKWFFLCFSNPTNKFWQLAFTVILEEYFSLVGGFRLKPHFTTSLEKSLTTLRFKCVVSRRSFSLPIHVFLCTFLYVLHTVEIT